MYMCLNRTEKNLKYSPEDKQVKEFLYLGVLTCNHGQKAKDLRKG